MIKFIKAVVSGKKSVVPQPMFSRDSESTAGLNPLRGHNVSASSSAYTNVIPNVAVSRNLRNYTPPKKNTPFAVIPEGVCRNC